MKAGRALALAVAAASLAACATAPPAPPRADPVARVVAPFFDAVAREDLAAVQTFITPDATVQAMFNPNGLNGADHIRTFPATAYFGIVSRNYDNIAFADRVFSVADDGRTVWMEAQGQLVVVPSGAPYRNGYVFKLTLENGRIRTIQEWVNTVTLTQQGVTARPVGQ
jgi:ketosteroid isomerase-like protein